MKKKNRRLIRWAAAILVSPIALFLLLALLIYLPPVQNFVVQKATEVLSERMGMDIRIGKVRLAFPLDLAIHHTLAIEAGDTLLDARSLRLNVQMLPLLKGRAEVDGVELYDVKLDTRSYLPDTHLKGHAGELTAEAHSIDWKNERVRLDRFRLKDARFTVALSDTAQKDTVPSTAQWVVQVVQADIERSRIQLHMPGDSMRVGLQIGAAALRDGCFDTGRGDYAVRSLLMRHSGISYDLPLQPEAAGLDPNHLAFTELNLKLDTLHYTQQGVLTAGLGGLSLKEKSGLAVSRLQGSVYMDSTRLRLPALNLRTPYSRVDAAVSFDFKALRAGQGGHCHLDVDASIGREDLRCIASGLADPACLNLLPAQPLTLKAQAEGNMDHLRLPQLSLHLPGMARLEAKGYVTQPMSERRSGHFEADLRTQNLTAVKSLMPASLRQTIDIPNGLAARGTADFQADDYKAQLRVQAPGGTLQAKATLNLRGESYRLAAQAAHFPIHRFVKGVPLSPFTGQLRISGQGLDVLSPRSSLTADARIDQLAYSTYSLNGTSLQARLRGGKLQADFAANNNWIEASGQLAGLLDSKGYDLQLRTDVAALHLHELDAARDTLTIGTVAQLDFKANTALTRLSLGGSLRTNTFTTPRISNLAKDVTFDFATSADTTTASVAAGDLTLRLGSKKEIAALTVQLQRFASELMRQAGNYELDQERLKTFLPTLSFYLDAGRDNPLYNIARIKGYSFHSAYINLNTDPRQGMSGDARISALKMGALLLDSIRANIVQDSTGVQLYALVKNGQKNPTPLEVRCKSYVLPTGAGLELKYLDSEGQTGVDLGVRAELAEGGLQVRLYPEHPVLAYRNFKLNKDNFVFLGKDKSIRADIDLLADDGTGLKIYGEPRDSMNDLTVSVNQLNLGELSTVLPYLPRFTGMLSGDIHVTNDTLHSQLSAMASFQADGFAYEGVALGDIGLEVLYLPKTGGEHHASAFISTAGEEVLACNGTYFDRDGGLFEGDAQLHDFPLALLNGFMAGTDVALKGKAAGELSVTGSLDRPVLNGSLDLDSAHIYSDVYGFDFRTDERALELNDSRLLFSDYKLYSTGKEPLVLNGVFDMSDFARMSMDFDMKAQNFELINTGKKAQSLVFGKVYANYLGTLKGTTDNLAIQGKLEVLDRTDMTYILKDSPLSVDDRLNNLVEFVSFSDTTQHTLAKPAPEGSFDLTLGISISDAARFHCRLSDDGQSYVNLEGGGDLTLRMTPQGDMRLTGRFTTNSGEMKYALPIIPLKTFKLTQGSYVEFTGDPMNPTLGITAKERTKAVVTENGQQRSVAFDVGVALSKPLDEMGLEFTIEAPEDLAVQNQLASMSAEQRGKAAVTLMATGMYMTDETMMSGSGFKANNALNAFLQSEIQNIAGSALRTIDINLGVESGTSEAGTSTTDYSFQFAKRFWGNRISVIIGGKVSTGADATNSAESFISNISVEYRLDRSATRYVKVFYDRETQDPLEGQLTKTGAGLVLRRKTDKLGELFVFKKKK